MHEVGILLDAGYVHPAQFRPNHLRCVGGDQRNLDERADEVLELVGMTEVADRKLKGYSLGMKQRLGLASTLLGDPATIILDEPANGLDPEGIRWIRDFLRHYATQGRTVLVSSHLLGEMSLLAEELVVIGRGKLISQSSVDDFVRRHARRVGACAQPAATDVDRDTRAKRRQGREGRRRRRDRRVRPRDRAGRRGRRQRRRSRLHELATKTESLEDAFLSATADSQEYRSGGPA